MKIYVYALLLLFTYLPAYANDVGKSITSIDAFFPSDEKYKHLYEDYLIGVKKSRDRHHKRIKKYQSKLFNHDLSAKNASRYKELINRLKDIDKENRVLIENLSYLPYKHQKEVMTLFEVIGNGYGTTYLKKCAIRFTYILLLPRNDQEQKKINRKIFMLG